MILESIILLISTVCIVTLFGYIYYSIDIKRLNKQEMDCKWGGICTQ